MSTESPLKDKVILVVDDEPDVLETVEEELDGCVVHTAQDYDTALQYLLSYTYDVVVLDIMGGEWIRTAQECRIQGISHGDAYCPRCDTRSTEKIH